MTVITVSTDRIRVPFEGGGAGTGELTWAQRDVWDIMRRTGRTMNIGGTVALPPGLTLDAIANLVRGGMSRHPSLRTRLWFAEDGTPRQVVSAAGEIEVEIVDTGDGEDPEVVLEALRVRYQITPFEPVTEWPARFGVLRRGDALTHLVAMYFHVVIDGYGLDALMRDLGSLDLTTATSDRPVTGLQALEQARLELTPAMRQRSDKSLRYWDRLLRTIPARRLAEPTGDPAERPQPPIWELRCTSTAMHRAAGLISARTAAESGPVLLAAAAVALARITGVNPTVVQVLVSNRFRPGLAESVTNTRQLGLCVIDVADGTFDAVVARAWRASMTAFVHGYYDTVDHQELVRRVGVDRGEEVDISFYVNDRRNRTRELAGDAVPTGDEIRAALPLTTVDWGVREDTYDGTFYLHLEDVPDVVSFAIFADTHRIPPATMRAYAREFEAVLVAGALDPDAPVLAAPAG